MTKFEKFLEEYGHNKLIFIYAKLNEKTLNQIVTYHADTLYIVWEPPIGFCHDRVFYGKLISGSYEEVMNYFGQGVTEDSNFSWRTKTSPIRGDTW